MGKTKNHKKTAMSPPPVPERPSRRRTPPPPAVPSTSTGIRASAAQVEGIPTPQSSVASWMPTIGSVRSVSQEENGERADPAAGWDREEMEVDGGFGRIADEEMSVVTTASQKEAELIRLGIRREDIEDIKSNAASRLNGIGNNMCLRVRYEMQELVHRKEWEKIAERAPYAAYFITQLVGGRVNNN